MKKIMFFHSPACPPCRFCERETIDKVKSVEVQRVNVMKDWKTTERHGVKKIPTIIILDGDNEMERLVGGIGLEELKKYL